MKKFLAALPFLLTCTALQAAPIQIIDLPTETSGGFPHNLFHNSSDNQGQTGVTLAWFDLGTGGSYDPDTGHFLLNINLWLDSALTMSAGTADADGNLTAASFIGNSLGPIGSITWTFDAIAQANGLPATSTTNFVDRNYAISDAGYIPNSYTGSSMTLWGSSCVLDAKGNCENFQAGVIHGLGVDFVATFVPVPAAIWLFGSGLLALVGISRRRARHS